MTSEHRSDGTFYQPYLSQVQGVANNEHIYQSITLIHYITHTHSTTQQLLKGLGLTLLTVSLPIGI